MWSSTRGGGKAISFSRAMLQSIPPEGGLYVPEQFPFFDPEDFGFLDPVRDLAVIAEKVLRPFLVGDSLESQLAEICRAAFNFPIPLVALEPDTEVLELFHGPTLAFKDVGARFLAECISRLPEHRTVLVATSGDTGGAVAAAFHGKPGISVAVLYPQGRISPEQEKQLTCWGDNVRAFSVRGDFDACQRVVKEAFADAKMKAELSLISANSINVGRLLPQTIYYAASSLDYRRRHGVPAGYVIPSGNLGNAVAAFWARRMGFPIREIRLATNANRTLSEFFASGDFRPQTTVATLANAMDVGSPNNFERLQSLLPDFEELKKIASATLVDDATIRTAIEEGRRDFKYEFCPHTATAFRARKLELSPDWIIVATAHPAKFASVVGSKVAVPAVLQALFDRPRHSVEMEPNLAALRTALAG